MLKYFHILTHRCLLSPAYGLYLPWIQKWVFEPLLYNLSILWLSKYLLLDNGWSDNWWSKLGNMLKFCISWNSIPYHINYNFTNLASHYTSWSMHRGSCTIPSKHNKLVWMLISRNSKVHTKVASTFFFRLRLCSSKFPPYLRISNCYCLANVILSIFSKWPFPWLYQDVIKTFPNKM